MTRMWVTVVGLFAVGVSVVSAVTCPDESVADTADALADCQCRGGYYMDGSDCTQCPSESPSSAIGSSASSACVSCTSFTMDDTNAQFHVEGDRTWRWGAHPTCSFQFHVQMSGTGSNWMAFGLSADEFMASTDVLVATHDGADVTYENRWSPSQSTPSCDADDCDDDPSLTLHASSSDGDDYSVHFSRDVAVFYDGKDREVEDGVKIIFQFGSGGFSYHGSRQAQIGTIDLTATGQATTTTGAIANESEKKFHGSLMVIAWLCLANVGIFVARYMKKAVGAPLWFVLHRGIQSLAILITFVAAIIIFSAVDYRSDTHQMLGVIVLILAVIQTLLGIFRNVISQHHLADPHDKSDHGPRRWIFNYLHWWTGRALVVLSVITIWEGLSLLFVDDGKTMLTVWIVGAALLFVALEVLKQTNDKTFTQKVWHQVCSFFVAFSAACAVAILVAIN